MALGRDLMVATMFLTRLPIRSTMAWQEGDLAASVPAFPIVGALLGLLGAGAYALASSFGLPPLIAATLAVALSILITGALHEDGLADIADGFGGGRIREEKLRIMRDSRLGSYGTLALVMGVVLRLGAIASLAQPSIVAVSLIAAGALSRAAMPIAMTMMQQARAAGLAASVGKPHPGRAAASALIAFLLTCLCLPLTQMVAVIAASLLGASILLILAKRQIGGITGDVLGALQQVVEIFALLILVAINHQP